MYSQAPPVALGFCYFIIVICISQKRNLQLYLQPKIYVELACYKNGKGVITQCCYYDRTYKRQDIKITR